MKLLHWICAASVAGNLALGWHLARRPAPPTGAPPVAPTPLAGPAHGATAPLAPGSGTLAFNRADTPLAKALDGSDLRAMRDALEASGLTEADARAILRNRLRDGQKAARDAIANRRNPVDDTWWYQDEETRQKFEDQRRADRRVLDNQLNQTLASLFGPEAAPPAEAKIHAQAKFLPADKQRAVTTILEDYETMLREARPRGYSGASLPSDEEKRRFIEEERRRDLAEILSPEELRAYDLRHSQTAQNIRWQLAGMKPTLAEYEAIFDARHTLDSRFDLRGTAERPPDFWQKRQEAETAAMEQLRRQLGESRYIDYAISNDHGARTVETAVQRYGLPPDTTRQLWTLRQQTGREAKAVYDDKNLDRAQKIDRLAEIARRSRRQLDGLLTPEAQAELRNNNFVKWVSGLEKNQITLWNDSGNSSSGYGL